MGLCRYCGQPAGFMKAQHKDCRNVFLDGLKKIRELASFDLIANQNDSAGLVAESIFSIARQKRVGEADLREVFIEEWERASIKYMDDGVLTEDEEKKLAKYMAIFNLNEKDLDRKGAHRKIAQASILRSVLDGHIPINVEFNGDMPINLQKTERVVWIFSDVEYLEDKVKRSYVGQSHGLSIKIAKGIYYRPSVFKGYPIETKQRVHVDTGSLIVTDKNIYFYGPQKSFRIPYQKIVSFMQFDNGIGIMKDTATAKPQIFVTNEGWYSYNLITNLASIGN